MTEFELIDLFFRRPTRHTVLGVGDDAALLAPTAGTELAVSVDMLVEGRHFFAGVDARTLGHKTLAVNLSDLAAMGALPRWALLAGALPRADSDWLAAFAAGFFGLADRYDVDLVGGDTTQGPLNLCVTVIGEVASQQALRRSGARAGDSIWLSGTLGDAALALAHRLGRLRLASGEYASCEAALLMPSPRVELGIRLRRLASAAIDVSDGLTSDLGHVLAASGVGAVIEFGALPRSPALARQLDGHDRGIAIECLLAGGDDYELCFSAPPQHDGRIAELERELRIPLTRIGHVTAAPGLIVRGDDGLALTSLPRGFDHFADRSADRADPRAGSMISAAAEGEPAVSAQPQRA